MTKMLAPVCGLLTLGLVACGGGGNNTPDPLSLSFTVNGVADWTPPAQAVIQDTFLSNSPTISIGTFNTDRTVKLTITPEQVKQAGFASATAFRNSFGETCNGSGLSIYSDFSYYQFSASDVFSIAGDKSYIRPRIVTSNPDGSSNFVDRRFVYVKVGGTISGTVICSDGNVNVNLTLKPGWNVTQDSYTYNPTTEIYTNDALTLVSNSNTDTGPWMVYDAN